MGFILEGLEEQERQINTIHSLMKDYENGVCEPLENHAAKFLSEMFYDDVEINPIESLASKVDNGQELYFTIRPRGFLPKDSPQVVCVKYSVGKGEPKLLVAGSDVPFCTILNKLEDISYWRRHEKL